MSFFRIRIFMSDLIASIVFSPVRVLFAFLGMVFGVSSVVLVVATIKGSSLMAEKVIKKLGPDSVLILSGSIGEGPRRKYRNLSVDDLKEISRLEGITDITYGLIKPMSVRSSDTSKFTVVFGVGRGWVRSWGYKMEEGRDFTDEDFVGFNKVCIVGHDVADFLFPHQNPVGKVIIIGRTPFRIVGMYEKRGKTPNGHNLDDRVFLPITVYRKVVEPEYKHITLIRFRVLPGVDYVRIVSETRKVLLRNHDQGEFSIITPTVVKRFLSIMSASLSLFLGIASVTALVVGAFVMSSIFYINIYVRSWEIGLRMAMGARKKDIKLRILGESMVVCAVASVFGIVVGFLAIKYLLPVLSVPVVYPVSIFFIAPLFAVMAGMIAVYSPAVKASSFEPSKVLRSRL